MSQTWSRLNEGPSAIIMPGLILVGLIVAGAEVAISRSSFDIWGGLVIAVLLLLVTLPFLASRAWRTKDNKLLPILVLALTAKLLGGFLYYVVIEQFFGGVADAAGYHLAAVEISELLRAGDVLEALNVAGGYRGNQSFAGLTSLLGTRFIPLLTGAIYTVIGTSYLGGFIFFSWLAFLGAYFFYRAFSITFPTVKGHRYLILLFFLPSMLFWSSTIGKEAWMMLSLGLAAFGAARLLEQHSVAGFSLLGLGTLMMAAVRIHVAALVGAAVVVAYILRRQNNALRELAPVAKGLTLSILLVAGLLLAARGQAYLVSRGLDPDAGITAALLEVSERTGEAGSDFEPVVVRSPIQLPAATWTVLFRPHPLEARDALGALAAVEGLFLLFYAVAHWRHVTAAMRSLRQKAYVTHCLVFTLLFIVAFSSYANFGLLLRQRIQVIPFLLVVLSFPRENAAESEAVGSAQSR